MDLPSKRDDVRPVAFIADEFEALHRSRARIRWEPWAVELMLRSAVQLGRRGQIAEWMHRYVEEAPVEAGTLRGELAAGRRMRRLLTSDELRVLVDDRDPAPPGASELILRSLIAHGRPGDRERIRAWTRRMVTDDA